MLCSLSPRPLHTYLPIHVASTPMWLYVKLYVEHMPGHCLAAQARYRFATPSTMKPTQWSYPGGSINQIPGQATVAGDCRVTPFYDLDKVR
jgi:acetylornithine deacetylase